MTARFQLGLAREIVRPHGRSGEESRYDREELFAFLWTELARFSLEGVHEGTMLADEAHAQGLETESFTVDAALAPRERDWISGQAEASAELYFADLESAQAALEHLKTLDLRGVTLLSTAEDVPAQDWDAEWKRSFPGIRLPPFWHILPPWKDAASELKPGERLLRLNPGAGFGTGTHETTQLCLERLGELALARGGSLRGMRVFDFGSGSGILSIGAALLGATVDACEIDPLANENAAENARLNGLEPSLDLSADSQLRIGEQLDDFQGPYDLVIANILRPVLIEFRDRLLARRKPGAGVLLSGLVEADVAEVSAAYGEKLGGRKPQVRASGDWRSLWWEAGNA